MEEVPVIDLSAMFGDLNARKGLAETVCHAAENTGFFYIKNHGINERVAEAAQAQARDFFHQKDEEKAKVARTKSRYFNGWHRRKGTSLGSSASLDDMEQFSCCYNPDYDPEVIDLAAIPDDTRAQLPAESFIWEGTEHLPHFQRDCIRYWQESLQLARRLLRIFALSLNLPETYFDNVTTCPGRYLFSPIDMSAHFINKIHC